MPSDVLIKTRRHESSETLPDPAPKSATPLVRCMECGQRWPCERDSEAIEIGRAHTAETSHTRVLIIRSVHHAA